jgi:protein O-GlcNAc transferase
LAKSQSKNQQLFEQAVGLQQAGQLAQAQALYRQLLAAEPRHADALHLLGTVEFQLGRAEAGVELVERAIAINPQVPFYHANRGAMLAAMRRFADAAAAFRRALALNPDLPDAQNSLGMSLQECGQIQQSIEAYQQALKLRARFPQALTNLGIALMGVGKVRDAIGAFEQSIAQEPTAEAFSNLGVALRDVGRLEEARVSLEKAIALWPQFADAHNNLGTVLKDLGQPEQAIAEFERALQIQPGMAKVMSNLANALRVVRRHDEAITVYRQALVAEPGKPEIFSNLANALKAQGRLDEALQYLDKAMLLAPKSSDVHSNRLFTILYHPSFDAAKILAEEKLFDERHGRPLARFIAEHKNDRNPDRRLRIGYVSPDFRDHIVGRNILPLIREHDREQFEVFCYDNAPGSDAMAELFRKRADAWRPIQGVDDQTVAEMIHKDGIDILVDLALHTAHNRLPVFARKPAPVQVCFAGYPGGTGLAAMDYRLTDPYLDPPGKHDDEYVERSIRLADSFWCYDPSAMGENGNEAADWNGGDLAVGELPARRNKYVTFGCLNNFAKVNDAVFAVWAGVLRAMPDSRLRLMVPAGETRQRTAAKLAELGIESGRIALLDGQPRLQYLQCYREIDLVLDSWPYNGHTTSLDALWMGVPVVSRIGRTVAGRAGFSQLSNLNLAELAADSDERFQEVALRLARELERLEELRRSLRQRMLDSPLTNATKFARNIEAAYREVWRNWCGG